MCEYLRWIADTFPQARLRGQGATYAETVRDFRTLCPPDSIEHGELLDHYISHASERYSRLGILSLLETMHSEVQTVRHIQNSRDGDMHQYIKWIMEHRPDAALIQSGATYRHVLQDFLQHAPRESPEYRKVFACFYRQGEASHSEPAIADFVAEVEWQMLTTAPRRRSNHAVAVTPCTHSDTASAPGR